MQIYNKTKFRYLHKFQPFGLFSFTGFYCFAPLILTLLLLRLQLVAVSLVSAIFPY